MSLPPLPVTDTPWSSNVYNVANVLQDLYRTANAVLSHASPDIHRLQFHQDSLINDALPLLLALEENADVEGLPRSWLEDCVGHISDLLIRLCETEREVTGV